ncbi:alanine--tRNA ligase [archaeon]|jgi:alanyl-tRNA synthetase|nr:alanine--tRNA ligase [archaeon]MBT3451637.1 alanine--tRNA ligase [archaeon]MBT6869658.1 alanine--tRNA ligase [archaeon]MBT7192426.1 alanine--tRNA ligase [archaeon]MBT7380227.1 alanine--tRNA ligase [archaeon]
MKPVKKITKARDIKKAYLEFFKSKNHKIIDSASLIPENDPTVLFTTAGMHPLVPFLVGQQHPLGKRVANVQKCLRTGDIDEVGDTTHHTFFEMMGNWSFGDYFKKEAIEMSFEFLTKVLGIPISHFAVTCFKGDNDAPCDEESAKVWLGLGVPEERIAYLDKKDNWWGPAGETGPCGPDTEMFVWVGKEDPPKIYDFENGMWVEIWNDVFMAYDKTKEGKYLPLKQKNVDTGLGLERVTSILQGFDDNYRTELFWPIIENIEKLTKKKYGQKNDQHYINKGEQCWVDVRKKMRVIADHLRATVFILGDERAITPSNVDQGYILRRFIRRTIRNIRVLGVIIEKVDLLPFIKQIIEMYQEDYPLLGDKKDFIINEVSKEQTKFIRTLEKGLNKFENIASGKESNHEKISGQDAFLLFQSFGFPIEMTIELANERKIEVDVKSFNEEYEKHQELSRKGAEKKFKGGLSDASEETTKLHTATHLLGEALNNVLKEDIKQRGSNITPERLRFDFNFDRKLTSEELKAVEEEVNKVIEAEMEIVRAEMHLKEALDLGACGEFGAKYPEIVSVYTIGKNVKKGLDIYSKEICMGPHVNNTKELVKFKIKKEQSSSSGVRRIKAVLVKE